MSKNNFDPENWNWLEYLNSDKETQLKHHEQALKLAFQWPTCACGELCKALPRHLNGRPKDMLLGGEGQLGHQFHSAIVRENFEYAKIVFTQIENRTAKLLKQINKQN